VRHRTSKPPISLFKNKFFMVKNQYRYAATAKKSGHTNARFIDEIQERRSKVLRQPCEASLQRDDGISIYTGSNAKPLSGELASLLAGRHGEIHPR
jgi:predicted AAA+ superfamily ATPase